MNPDNYWLGEITRRDDQIAELQAQLASETAKRRAAEARLVTLDPDTLALVADHKAGQEAVEMLRWLHNALMQAPGNVSDALGLPHGWVDLYVALRDAMKGDRT